MSSVNLNSMIERRYFLRYLLSKKLISILEILECGLIIIIIIIMFIVVMHLAI